MTGMASLRTMETSAGRDSQSRKAQSQTLISEGTASALADEFEEIEMSRRGGNSDNPFCADGINSFSGFDNDPSGFKADGSGSSPRDGWGNNRATGRHFLDKAENRRPDRESKYSTEKTRVDDPTWPSDERVRRTSAQPWNGNPYSAGNGRKG